MELSLAVRLTKYSNKHKKMNETLKISISNQFRNTSIEDIETKGKTYYFKSLKHNAILTVNSHTFTVITAKQINKTFISKLKISL